MDASLETLIYDRLAADSALDERVASAVLAACDGPEALARELAGSPPGAHTAKRATEPAPMTSRPAYLRSIAVEGFRGVGPQTKLELEPGPGLTLVVGRNGSGKSSFAEALELLLNGDLWRWKKRKQKIWSNHWQCLHHDGPTRITASLDVDGIAGPQRLEACWEQNTDPSRAPAVEQAIDAWGWRDALTRYRPFLAYSELAETFDRTLSEAYRELSRVLGLDDIEALRATLTDARKARDEHVRDRKDRTAALLADAADVEDERASRMRDELGRQRPDLAALRGLVENGDTPSDHGALAPLRQIAGHSLPDDERVHTALDAYRDAGARRARVPSTAVDAQQTADLLSAALAHHRGHPTAATCPVCATPDALGAGWAERVEKKAEQLRGEASELRQSEGLLAQARRDLMSLFGDGEQLLEAAGQAGLASPALLETWAAWQGDPAQPLTIDAVRRGFQTLVDQAYGELDRRNALWRPLANDLRAWLERSDVVAREKDALKTLKQAEKWVRDTADDLRRLRFEPIERQAQENWELLRAGSNVELRSIELIARASGRVDFDVRVDDSEAPALGVMSQGELVALALSVFLPRACLPESPFRFALVDDPVQSMDPAKVDGLAKVLSEAARTRQLVVFTHDSRLCEALKALDLPATVVEVSRRARSQVELVPAKDPVQRHLDDATMMLSAPDLDAAVIDRVVPNLTRQALEAACVAKLRRTWLAAGKPHEEIDAELESLKKLTTYLAAALLGDRNEHRKVSDYVANKFGPVAPDAIQWANRGSHGAADGDAKEMVAAIRDLCRQISS